MQRDVRAMLDGTVGGGVGTVAMSGVMLAARGAGLTGELPPERITAAALEAGGLPARDERLRHLLAAATHLAFGGGAGALFGILHRRLRPPVPPALHGAVFATLVWAVSYRGWVPALGILPPAERDRPDRTVTMVLAHWVYGAVLGAVVARRGR